MKIFKVFAVFMMASLFLVGCSDELRTPDMDQNQQELVLKGGGNGANQIDFNGPHFELNLLGKKDNWNDKEVDNPDRHTMFIPRNTEGWEIILKSPNNIGEESLPGIRIDMTQGEEFAVLDGTVFDGDGCEFQLGPGKYEVFVAMRGKKNVDPAFIQGWLEALETTMVDGVLTEELWYYQSLGSVNVTRKWQNITGLFTITESEAGELPWPEGQEDPMWIFDYMDWLGVQTISYIDPDTGELVEITYSELAYFWQLINNGSQNIKVRFYPVD